jgi:hypothetical protein
MFSGGQTARQSTQLIFKKKHKLRVSEKAKSGIMPKNSREHVVLKGNLKHKNTLKFCSSRVFRSLTRGTVDRDLLHKPPASYYRQTYTKYLDNKLSNEGKFSIKFRPGNNKFSPKEGEF